MKFFVTLIFSGMLMSAFGGDPGIYYAQGNEITIGGKTFYLDELEPQQSFSVVPILDPDDVVNVSHVISDRGLIRTVEFIYKGKNDDLIVDTIQLRWILTREIGGQHEILDQGFQTTSGELVFNGGGARIDQMRIPSFDDLIEGLTPGDTAGNYRIFLGVTKVVYKGGEEQKCFGLDRFQQNRFRFPTQERWGICTDAVCELLTWNGGSEFGIIRWWSCTGYAPGIDCKVSGANLTSCSMSICAGSPL
jgi:hypothetical protein